MEKKRKTVDPLLASLCRAIQERRESLAISQEELAGRCGLHRTYISAIERGSRNITLKSLGRLCGALEIATSELVKAAEMKAEEVGKQASDAVFDELIEELLDRLISDLGEFDSGQAHELMLEALWLKHRLKDTRWQLPENRELTLHRFVREGTLQQMPQADRTARELASSLKNWRRLEAL
jgi:transcriptional regulator with XRE-family HTH domain